MHSICTVTKCSHAYQSVHVTIKVQVYGVFTLPDSDSYTDSYEMYKGYTRTDSNGYTDTKSQ